MDIIISSDGLYYLIEVTKEMVEGETFNNCFDLCDIMIVPQFLMHYTEPNKVYFKKRIISFDFHLDPVLF